MIECLFSYLPTLEAQHPVNWREEAEAAEELDFVCHSFDMERFLDGDVEGALEHLPNGGGRTLVYRGWLLKEDEYRSLEDEVNSHGYSLLTNTNQNLEALLLPNWHLRVAEFARPPSGPGILIRKKRGKPPSVSARLPTFSRTTPNPAKRHGLKPATFRLK